MLFAFSSLLAFLYGDTNYRLVSPVIVYYCPAFFKRNPYFYSPVILNQLALPGSPKMK